MTVHDLEHTMDLHDAVQCVSEHSPEADQLVSKMIAAGSLDAMDWDLADEQLYAELLASEDAQLRVATEKLADIY